jgi:hypothetical protein
LINGYEIWIWPIDVDAKVGCGRTTVDHSEVNCKKVVFGIASLNGLAKDEDVINEYCDDDAFARVKVDGRI